MNSIIIIIDLHCDASLPPGTYEFGGGNKYSRNLIDLLLSQNIPFIYFTHKKLPQLEKAIQLCEHSHFIRLELKNLGIDDKNQLHYYKNDIIQFIECELQNYENYTFIFHSIYWHSGEIAAFLSEKHETFFVHTVISNGKSKLSQNAFDDIAPERCLTEQQIFDAAKYIICSSESEANDIAQYYNIDSLKLIVTGRWIERAFLSPYYDFSGNPRTYRFNADMPVHYLSMKYKQTNFTENSTWWLPKSFLFVGRIHKNKGITQIILAWQQLYKKYTTLTPPLWIVGGTPFEITSYKKEHLGIISCLSKAESENKIIWWGTLPPEGISTLMLKSQVLLMHSQYEAGGNVILEAMSHALPVIATPFGYAKDYIISGKNGYLVEFNDVDTFAKTMEYFIKQPYLSNYLGRTAQSNIHDISTNWNFKEKHLQLYGIENQITQTSCVKQIIPKDSINIYPYSFTLPEEAFIYQVISKNITLKIINIQGMGNIENYYLWHITTKEGIYYFYFLYPIINWKCLESHCDNYVINQYQRTTYLQKECVNKNISIYYINKSEGYILLNETVNINL